MQVERPKGGRGDGSDKSGEQDARSTGRILQLKGANRAAEAGDAPAAAAEHSLLDERTPELIEVLERHRGERHLVVLQDYPDPDSISCAFAHQLISTRFGIDVDITYSGRISHQENVALVRLLGLDLILYDADQLDLQTYDGAVFVDSQGTTTRVRDSLEEAGVPIVVVVDHHERQEGVSPEFLDLRRVGATATIYTNYLHAGMLVLEAAQRAHVLLATALMHGIMSDTRNLLQGRAADFMAAAYLAQFYDASLLSEIMSQRRSKAVMETVERALQSRMIVENYSIAGIGYVRAENRDAIPQAADFLLTEENVHTAIVYGIVLSGREGTAREESVVGSLRTSKLTVDPDGFLKDVFGRSALGHFYGGGKREAGGFEITLDFLSGAGSEEYNELKWKVFDTQIKQRLLAKIGVSQPPDKK